MLILALINLNFWAKTLYDLQIGSENMILLGYCLFKIAFSHEIKTFKK